MKCTYCGKSVEPGDRCKACNTEAPIREMRVEKAIELIEEHMNFMKDQACIVPYRFLQHILNHLKALPHSKHPKPRQTSLKRKQLKGKKKELRRTPLTLRTSFKG